MIALCAVLQRQLSKKAKGSFHCCASTCGRLTYVRQVDDDDDDTANQRAMENDYRCKLSELSPLRKLDHGCMRSDGRVRTTEADVSHFFSIKVENKYPHRQSDI